MNLPTTLFADNQGDSYKRGEACHGGKGPFLCKDVLGKIKDKQFIKYFHDDILPPGSSFGDHPHKSDKPFEEWYFCLSGEGVMTLDGKDFAMRAGDISACYANGEHGIKNTGKEDMRILVIGVKPPESK